LEHEATVLGRVERQHRSLVRTTLRHFLNLDIYVILWITVLVHVVDGIAVLIVHLDDHHPATVFIALGVVVALVVVVFREKGRATAIFALVVIVLCPCPGGGPSRQDQNHRGAQRNKDEGRNYRRTARVHANLP